MMHANTEQLLAIKDGSDTPAAEHVASCPQCQAALKELQDIQHQLQSLDSQAPTGQWHKIQAAHLSQVQQRSSKGLTRAIYALAAAILLSAVMVIQFLSAGNEKETIMYERMVQLIVASNTLEQSVNLHMNQTDVQVSRSQIFRLERLKWRLKLIDQKIEASALADTDTLVVLWQDRVRALQAINDHFDTTDNHELL